jgi:hypothetical protein
LDEAGLVSGFECYSEKPSDSLVLRVLAEPVLVAVKALF